MDISSVLLLELSCIPLWLADTYTYQPSCIHRGPAIHSSVNIHLFDDAIIMSMSSTDFA